MSIPPTAVLIRRETAPWINEVNETSGNIVCVIDIVLWETLHFIMKILYIIRI